MADLLVAEGPDIDGTPVTIRYKDLGDGTFAKVYTTLTDGTFLERAEGPLVGGVQRKVRYRDMEDGSYAEVIHLAE